MNYQIYRGSQSLVNYWPLLIDISLCQVSGCIIVRLAVLITLTHKIDYIDPGRHIYTRLRDKKLSAVMNLQCLIYVNFHPKICYFSHERHRVYPDGRAEFGDIELFKWQLNAEVTNHGQCCKSLVYIIESGSSTSNYYMIVHTTQEWQ